MAAHPQTAITLAAVSSSFAYLFVMLLRYPMLTMTREEHEAYNGDWNGISAKTLLVLAYTIGYSVGKVPALFFVSKLPPWKRLRFLVAVVLVSFVLTVGFFSVASLVTQASLVLLGAIPISGAFGVMTQYLEGRHATDSLNSGLSVTLLLGGAVARATAKWVHTLLHDNWAYVPLVVAGGYLPVCLLFLLMLDTTPPPTLADARIRNERRPISFNHGAKFFTKYASGLALVFIGYILSSALRNYREFFAVDIYNQTLRQENDITPWQYIIFELPAAVVCVLALMIISRVKSNRNAVLLIDGLMMLGGCICLVCSVLYKYGLVEVNDPACHGGNNTHHFGNNTHHACDRHGKVFTSVGGTSWIMTMGVGMYLMYIPGGFILFDRLVAASGFTGTSVFLIYASDVVGQFGTFALVTYFEVSDSGSTTMFHDSHLKFFTDATYLFSYVMIAVSGASILYFWRALPRAKRSTPRLGKREYRRSSVYENEPEAATLLPRMSINDEPPAGRVSPASLMVQEDTLFVQCPHCSDRFSNQVALQIHIYQVHRFPSWANQPTQVKMRILALARDRAHFLGPSKYKVPNFSMKLYDCVAQASLGESPELQLMCNTCVPTLTSKEDFWEAYAGRVAEILRQYESGAKRYRHRGNFSSDGAYASYIQDMLFQNGQRIMVREDVGDVKEGDVGVFCGMAGGSQRAARVQVDIDRLSDLRELQLGQVELLEAFTEQNVYE